MSELLIDTDPSFLTWILVALKAEIKSLDRAPAASCECHADVVKDSGMSALDVISQSKYSIF